MAKTQGGRGAVAKVECGDKVGTAFLVSPTHAITALHVVEVLGRARGEVTLTFARLNESAWNTFQVDAFVEGRSEVDDLVLLKLDKEVQTDRLSLAPNVNMDELGVPRNWMT